MTHNNLKTFLQILTKFNEVNNTTYTILQLFRNVKREEIVNTLEHCVCSSGMIAAYDKFNLHIKDCLDCVDNNQHTEHLIIICQVFKYHDLQKCFEALNVLHMNKGHMCASLNNVRADLVEKLVSRDMYSEPYKKDLFNLLYYPK